MKKKILSFIIAAVLLFQIAAIPNVSAAGVTLPGTYTFIDTCYSPVNGGTYVAMAKNFTDAQNHPARIYVSQNGEDWTEAKTFSQAKHYYQADVRQNIVWWEKEQKFVAIILNHLWFSEDGYTWEMVPEEIFKRSNAVIATNGQRLVVLAKASMLVFDDLENPPVETYIFDKKPDNNTCGKTIGISPEEPYLYFGTDQYKIWLCDSRIGPNGDPERPDTSAQLTENIGAIPYDMEWVSGLEGWITVNGKAVLRVVNNADKPSYSSLNEVMLSDGTANKEGFTAVAANDENIVFGTEKGKFYIAPNDKEVVKGTIPFTVVEAGYLDNTEEIRSISAAGDGMFFAVSKTKIFLIMQEDDGVWRFYDVGGSNISLENETRFEIPASGSYTTTFAPVNYDYKGNVSSDNIVSFDLISELPTGVTSEKLSDASAQFTIDSTVSGGHEIKYKAVTESGKTQEFVITVVDEDHIEITGNDNMAIPLEGDEAERYEYIFEMIGTDGNTMDREIVVNVETMPEGASFDSSSNTFIIGENTEPGEIVFTASSAVKPENKAEKRVNVSRRKPVKIVFDEAPDAVYIPYEGKALYKYSAKLYDQTDRELSYEKVKWSVEAKDIPSMDGVAMEENRGELSLISTLIKGTVTITAASASDAELIIQKDVKLNYTDRRIVDDDFAQFSLDTSVPAEGKLPLASRGPQGSTIKWRSTDENVITTDGTVIRPSREDKKVTLTGAWKYNTATIERKYEFLVKKAETLCVNGDLKENSTKGWNPKNNTELSVIEENGKNVLKSSGTGAYQTITFTNNSSYGFNARVKAPANGKIRLMSEKVGKIAEITSNGQYQDIKASYDYRKQKNSFEDKIYLEYTGDLLIDELKVYEITLELNAAAAAVNKAVYSKKEKDINAAADLLDAFYDLPVRDELRDKLDKINSSSSGGFGGSGGSGGGGGGSSSKNHSTAPSTVIMGNNTNAIPTPPKKEDNTADELDTYLLKFKDMKGHWARTDVEQMAELGVITGDGNDMFRPDDEVSRAEFAAMITRAMGLEPTAYENSFFDVVSGDWYSGYVQTVRSNNYMNGYDGLFNPNEAITREELAKVIVAAYNAKTNTKLETGKTLYFNDLDNISYWAYDYIVEAADMGFINGMTEELFAPKQHATRAQTAVMLKRVYDKLNPAQ